MNLRRLSLATFVLLCFAQHLLAEAPRALPAGKLPNDQRLGDLKDLDGYFPFTPSATADAWKPRAEYVRRQILVACGLWPLPPEVGTPVKATIHGRVDREEYTVERVYFQSVPGLYVTGSLYRPRGKSGKLPAVLCPHGHWSNGRFHDHGEQGIENELKSGGEKFRDSGRHPLQARCVQLARMGCVVFHFDMLGYADNVPLPQSLVHGFAKQRPALSTPERYGLFSAQAELRSQNVFGMQTLNSIRALDFLAQLPDVDPTRIGVTGASGGGTQTFILAAIDSRPAAAFPAVMVSTAMQGGCTCENACYLRVDTGNIEFAALFAPKPLAMSAADDWTKDLMTKGFPELQQHYRLLGAPEHVAAKYFKFPHNYNLVARTMMYEWFNQHLKLGQSSPIVEREFKPLAKDEMTVWNAEHPQPAVDEAAELSLVKSWDERSQQQLAALAPRDAATLAEFRRVVGGGIEVLVGRPVPEGKDLEHETTSKREHDDYFQFAGLVRNARRREELPVACFFPKKWNRQVVLWIDHRGKASLYADDGGPNSHVKQLLAAGMAVASVDLLYQGEFVAGDASTKSRSVKNPREFAGFTLGYNHPLFAQRVHDILTLVSFVKHDQHQPEKIHLVGLDGAGPWVAAAGSQAGDLVDKIAVDTAGFRFASLTDIRDVQLWPGAVKHGDVPALLALCAPHPLWLAGEKETPTLTTAAYQAAQAGEKLTRHTAREDDEESAVTTWLTK